jgi:hypothetical protein
MRARNARNGWAATGPRKMQRGFPHAVPGGRGGGGMVLRCGELCHGRRRAASITVQKPTMSCRRSRVVPESPAGPEACTHDHWPVPSLPPLPPRLILRQPHTLTAASTPRDPMTCISRTADMVTRMARGRLGCPCPVSPSLAPNNSYHGRLANIHTAAKYGEGKYDD